ncbi:MAG: helix-turn-helix domain-containing protein [Thermocladium sp.]
MYLVTLRISSSCGLAAAAEESRGSVYSLQAIPVNDEANSVLSFMRISGKRDIQEVYRGLRKDFIKISLLNPRSGNLLFISGLKRGHGVLRPLASNGILPLIPLIASPGIEFFSLLTNNLESVEKFTREVSVTNRIEYVDYEKIDGNGVAQLLERNMRELYIHDLEKEEKRALSMAYEMGYYSWPKGIKMDQLANELGYSKPTISYYLRKAERKIIGKLLFGN